MIYRTQFNEVLFQDEKDFIDFNIIREKIIEEANGIEGMYIKLMHKYLETLPIEDR